MPVTVVTDTTHYLPQAIVRGKGLHEVSLYVTFEGRQTREAEILKDTDKFYDAMRNLEATLATGITTVRDAAGADAGIKKAVDDGVIAGPRMRISVNMLSQTGGHADGWLRSVFVAVGWRGCGSRRRCGRRV